MRKAKRIASISQTVQIVKVAKVVETVEVVQIARSRLKAAPTGESLFSVFLNPQSEIRNPKSAIFPLPAARLSRACRGAAACQLGITTALLSVCQ